MARHEVSPAQFAVDVAFSKAVPTHLLLNVIEDSILADAFPAPVPKAAASGFCRRQSQGAIKAPFQMPRCSILASVSIAS